MRFFVVIAFTLVTFSINALGCDCAGESYTGKSIDEVRKGKKIYFLNEFSGAAFIGKIVKRERVNVNWVAQTLAGEPSDFQMYRYTIRVKEYWLGIKSPTVILYGEPEEQIHGNFRYGSFCGFRLTTGKVYFFTPRFNQNNLEISMCDFAGGGSLPSEPQAIEFRKIMGEPRRF